jgi:hypothetical protein
MSNVPKKEENGVFTDVKNAVVNAATNAGTTLTQAAANVASNINKTANAAVNGANAAMNGAVNGANTAAKGANTFVNSLIPFNKPMNNRPANNKPANKPANNQPANRPANNFMNMVPNNKNLTKANNALVNAINAPLNTVNKGGFNPALVIFITLILLFMILYAFFSEQIKTGYENLIHMIRKWLGLPSTPDVQAEIVPIDGNVATLVPPPVPPTEPHVDRHLDANTSAVVEKVLPLQSGAKEVFNVATNDYTYYDAEPLCKALGAELASYNQVQKSWEKGADWCNYGWVKGQMAVYPTQKDTYDKVQNGPADQKGSCGNVGVNGGYFDNPELKLGVNCYGTKPDQSTHNQPSNAKTPDELEELDKINRYKEDSNNIPINPYNTKKWSSA